MNKIFNNEKGVNLITLSVAIIIIIAIAGIVLYNVRTNLGIQKLQTMQSDIENLKGKVSNYYLQYGAIPILEPEIDESVLLTNVKTVENNNVDKGNYYIIDLSALENLTLTYGKDYEIIKNEPDNISSLKENTLTDIYVINSVSHNIFYVAGINYEGKLYYKEYQDVEDNDIGISKFDFTDIETDNWSPIYSSTKKYKDKNEDIAVIPAGFRVSRKTGEDTIKNGLVVRDENENEFVWIPVDNPNDMFGKLSDGTLAGKIYSNWTKTDSEPLNWKETNGVMEIISPTDNREPDVITTYDSNINNINIINSVLSIDTINVNNFKNYLQEDFKKMITSVQVNKGFYVGRYETSIDENTIKSKKGEISANSMDRYNDKSLLWHGLYAKQKLYNTDSVQGGMIWGCQYDQIMKWMQKNNIDVSSTEPLEGTIPNTGNTTGNIEEDKLNNIYDLIGGKNEFTMEAKLNHKRVYRGNAEKVTSGRNEEHAAIPKNNIGSRLSVYIKN